MKAYKRYSTVRQMAGGVAMFAALALVLESGAISEWAQRLELGSERTVAVPVAAVLHRGLAWTGLERVRQRELAGLARVGWSDDAAAVADAEVRVKDDLHPNAAAGPKLDRPLPDAKSGVAATVPAVKRAEITPLQPLQPMMGDPPLTSALPAIAAVPAGGTRRVALAGDSMMAVGLSSTLLREAPKYKDLELVKTFKSGTGLARPEVFDWQSEYPAMLKDAMLKSALAADEKPEVVVVAIGANDGQGFIEDGVTYPFGTAGWQAIYQRRVQAFLAMLEADGATVVWIGLPPMKSDVYDAKIALVNRIDYAVVSASPHAVWFSSAGLLGDAKGRFQDYGQVRGAMTRLRQADGIHLSDEGATLLSAKLLPWLAKQAPAPVAAPAAKAETATLAAKSPDAKSAEAKP
jgi:hypothetical protein